MPERMAPIPYQYVAVARTEEIGDGNSWVDHGVATGLDVFLCLRSAWLAGFGLHWLLDWPDPAHGSAGAALSLEGSDLSRMESQASRASDTFCCFK